MNISEKIPQFENFTTAINSLFTQNQLSLIAKKDVGINDIFFSFPFKHVVHLKNKTVELNLRMIESYMPEILFAFCLYADSKRSISDLITLLAKQGFPNTAYEGSFVLLQHKIITFIETMLFADIFSKVWDGRIISDRVYAYKIEGILNYYTPYNVRVLLRSLLDTIQISINRTTDNGMLCFSFSLKLSIT